MCTLQKWVSVDICAFIRPGYCYLIVLFRSCRCEKRANGTMWSFQEGTACIKCVKEDRMYMQILMKSEAGNVYILC